FLVGGPVAERGDRDHGAERLAVVGIARRPRRRTGRRIRGTRGGGTRRVGGGLRGVRRGGGRCRGRGGWRVRSRVAGGRTVRGGARGLVGAAQDRHADDAAAGAVDGHLHLVAG